MFPIPSRLVLYLIQTQTNLHRHWKTEHLWCRQWHQSWYHDNSRFSEDDIHNNQQWKILWKPRMLITRRCRNLHGPYLFFGLPSAAAQITATDTCVINTHIKEFHYRHDAGSEQQAHQAAYFSWKTVEELWVQTDSLMTVDILSAQLIQ